MKIIKKNPLLNCNYLYTSASFKCNNYILTNPDCKQIKIYNYLLNPINKIETCNKYSVITEAKQYNQFYAVIKKDYKSIYILNNIYKEINKINLKLPYNYYNEILSIAYDCDNCKIIISQKQKVFSITLQGDFIKDELSKETIKNITDSNYITYKNLNGCCYKQPIRYNLNITSTGYFCNHLFIAYTKNNTAYISEISELGNIIKTYYIEDNIIINSIFNANNILSLLITKNNNYNYIYTTDVCQKCYCEIKSCDDECRIDYECLNYCHKECCNDVICSIACMEKGLAHILNSEGEKLQKGIKIAKDIPELLKINECINKTITDITLLEQVLHHKLETAIKCQKK